MDNYRLRRCEWVSAGWRSLRVYLGSAPRNQHQRSRPVLTISSPSPFLCERIQEDSNYEMEWLWSASQVTAPEEIRYCLERVLYINPLNVDAQRALSRLTTRRAISYVPVQMRERSFAPASDK